jgi:hypothetical protein
MPSTPIIDQFDGDRPLDASSAGSAARPPASLFVYRHSHLARQALVGIAAKQAPVCISAADLAARADSLSVSVNTTVMLAVSCMSAAQSNAFGCEGQFSSAVARFIHAHARAAGKHRVVAVLVAPSDNRCVVQQGKSAATFAREWCENTRWPYEAIAVFVPTLRRLSSEADVVAAMQQLPQLTPLIDTIPAIAIDCTNVENDNTVTHTLRCSNIDASSLRIADNGTELIAAGAISVDATIVTVAVRAADAVAVVAVWHETTTQWRQLGYLQVKSDDTNASALLMLVVEPADTNTPQITITRRLQQCRINSGVK